MNRNHMIEVAKNREAAMHAALVRIAAYMNDAKLMIESLGTENQYTVEDVKRVHEEMAAGILVAQALDQELGR